MLLGRNQRAVFGECGVHVAARFHQTVAMALGLPALRLEKVIADIRSRNVKIGTDPFQHASAAQELVADGVVGALDVLERLYGVEARKPHQQQQPAETGYEHRAAVDYQRLSFSGSQHRSTIPMLSPPRSSGP